MPHHPHRFTDKVALVTGGVSGIGEAVSLQLAREGAAVIAVDVSQDAIDRFLTNNSRSTGIDARVLDVSDPDAVDALVTEVAYTYGRVDVLVANAGIGEPGAVGDLTNDGWKRVLDVDLNGVFFTARAAMPHLIESRGVIVSTASISGLRGDQRLAAYNAAKAAVINLTRSMAVDYGPQGVRVNAVAPGPVATPMFLRVLENNPHLTDIYQSRIPLGRIAAPEEVAEGILFLASHSASYIHGVTLPIDGGFTASNAQPSLAG